MKTYQLFEVINLFFQKKIIQYKRKQIIRREDILKVFSKTVEAQGFTWPEAFRASRQQITFTTDCIETKILLVLYLVVLAISGIFSPDDYLFTVEGLLVNAILLAIILLVGSFLGFMFIPLHLIYGISNVFLLTVISVITASAMAVITPDLWHLIVNESLNGLAWPGMFFVFFVLILTANLFIYFHNTDVLSFRRFQKMIENKSRDFDLPADLRGRVLMLHAHDHYVEITTDKGKHLLRMRFSEALEKVEVLSGIQTHRSFWVAKGQILSIRTSGTHSTATLESGTKIPVTASRLQNVKNWVDIRN